MTNNNIVQLSTLVNKIVNFIDNITQKFIVFLLLTMTSVVLLQVFRRYVLNSALLWPEEVSRYLQIWLTFCGSAVALRKGEHVGVEAIIRLVPERIQLLIRVLFKIFVAIFLIVFIKFSWVVAFKNMRSTSMALGISLFWVRVALPVGGILMLIAQLGNIFNDFLRIRGIDNLGTDVVDK
ncbi:MAG: TRAP-type transport system small permease protein [Clostridia bacterium]|jgi:C4-dicarboxylate transporter DctQ subunit|nr:TRAP-type transport system small permease protein [Clostridia bacterium]